MQRDTTILQDDELDNGRNGDSVARGVLLVGAGTGTGSRRGIVAGMEKRIAQTESVSAGRSRKLVRTERPETVEGLLGQQEGDRRPEPAGPGRISADSGTVRAIGQGHGGHPTVDRRTFEENGQIVTFRPERFE